MFRVRWFFGMTALLVLQAQPHAPAQSPDVTESGGRDAHSTRRDVRPAQTPDEQLWNIIESLADPPPTSQPYPARLEQWKARRAQSLEKLQLYRRLYPGGARADDALRLEFEALFELASAVGDFRAFEARVGELEREKGNPHAAEEAAYWRIQCRRLQRTAAPRKAGDFDTAGSWDDYRKYLALFPSGRRTPRLAELLFEHECGRENDGECRRIVELLTREFPQHPTTERLCGRLWQREAVGRPLVFSVPLLDGTTADAAAFAGRTLLIAVWSAAVAASVDAATALQAQVTDDEKVKLLFLSIDENRMVVEQARDRAQLAGPIAFDGGGSLRALARTWGVEEVPALLVIDTQGRFVGMATSATWREVIKRAAAN